MPECGDLPWFDRSDAGFLLCMYWPQTYVRDRPAGPLVVDVWRGVRDTGK